jgi:hypothetical protein
MRTSILLVLVAAAGIGARPAALSAQLTITLRGAPAGTPVTVMSNGQRRYIGASDARGNVVVKENAINGGKGTRVNVKVVTNGNPEVILARADSTETCDNERRYAATRDRPECTDAGTFVLGETSSVTVTFPGLGVPVGLEVVRTTPAAPTTPATPATPAAQTTPATPATLAPLEYGIVKPTKFGVGLQVGYNHFYDFTRIAGMQNRITRATGDDQVMSYGLSLEYRPGWKLGNRELRLGGSISMTKQKFGQIYLPGTELDADSTRGYVKGYFFNSHLDFDFLRRSRLRFYCGGGPSLALNRLNINSAYADSWQTVNRSYTGLQGNFRVGGAFDLSNRHTLGVIAGLQRGNSEDADAHRLIHVRYQYQF